MLSLFRLHFKIKKKYYSNSNSRQITNTYLEGIAKWTVTTVGSCVVLAPPRTPPHTDKLCDDLLGLGFRTDGKAIDLKNQLINAPDLIWILQM
jgi:hypothetical protein